MIYILAYKFKIKNILKIQEIVKIAFISSLKANNGKYNAE